MCDISNTAGIPYYYKFDRKLTWKRKNAISIIYKWKQPESVKASTLFLPFTPNFLQATRHAMLQQEVHDNVNR